MRASRDGELEGVEFPDAFREVLGVSLEAFEDEFATHVLAETTRG